MLLQVGDIQRLVKGISYAPPHSVFSFSLPDHPNILILPLFLSPSHPPTKPTFHLFHLQLCFFFIYFIYVIGTQTTYIFFSILSCEVN